MNVLMPDGTTVTDVPEGTTRAELTAKLAARKPAPTPTEGVGITDFVNPLSIANLEGGANVLSGMMAKPASDIAGLAGIVGDATGLYPNDPAEVKRKVQEGMTYEPRTEAGKAVAEYNPLSLAGKAVGAVSDFTGNLVGGGEAGDTLWGATGNFIKEAIPQAISIAGARSVAGVPLKNAKAALSRAKTAVPDAALGRGGQLGLTASPTELGAGTLPRTMEAFGGPSEIHRVNSIANREVANDIVRQDLGLPETAPLTRETYKGLREERAAPYKTIDSLGDLDVNGTPMKASDMLENISQFRNDGFAAMKSTSPSDRAAGRTMLSEAGRLEGVLDKHVEDIGNPELMAQYRAARKDIAKIHTAEAATYGGNIDIHKLAQMETRGDPLSGKMSDLAKFSQQALRSTELPKGGAEAPVSPLGFIMSGPRWFAREASRHLLEKYPYGRHIKSYSGIPGYATAAVSQLRDNEGE